MEVVAIIVGLVAAFLWGISLSKARNRPKATPQDVSMLRRLSKETGIPYKQLRANFDDARRKGEI